MNNQLTCRIVFSLFARRFFKTVTVSFIADCDGTKLKDFCAKVKLPTRWRAKLFAARINKQQHWRYDGTPFDLRSKK
jgi:hypothetical protein